MYQIRFAFEVGFLPWVLKSKLFELDFSLSSSNPTGFSEVISPSSPSSLQR